MASIRIAMAQFDFPVGDVAGNTERIIEMIGQARDEHGAGLVICLLYTSPSPRD